MTRPSTKLRANGYYIDNINIFPFVLRLSKYERIISHTLSPNVDGLAEHHELLRAYPSEQEPGLRVFVPSPEYMLAMKLMAMRLDPAGGKSDHADIVNLMEVVGLKTPEQTIDFAAAFYPEAKISARLHLGIRELWRMGKNLRQEGQHGTPRYLGRGRTAS